jgi:hypothetical protein
MVVQHLNNDASELDLWDEFLMSSPRGHYCQLSTYLKSFKSYGCSSHIIVARHSETNRIIGGLGLLEFGISRLKLLTVPMGPIVGVGHEYVFLPLISEAISYSKSVGACLLQLKIPFTEDFSDPAILPKIQMPEDDSHRSGFPFDVLTVPNQMVWIEYGTIASNEEWELEMFRRFTNNKRRDIRGSERNGLSMIRVTEESELRRAYSLIELNGREQGYSTRSWEEFGPTLTEQVNKGQAIVLVACRGEQFLGTHYGVLAGQRWSNLMGGTVRTGKNYNVGAFLHWQAMKAARTMGLRGYDFTSWGSQGVMEFKKGFNPIDVKFGTPHYFVLSRLRFSAFMKVYPTLRKYKSTFARYAGVIYRQ